MSPSIETQERLNNDPKFREAFLAGYDFANAQSTPSYQRLWERVMKAEKWTPADAVNYYVGMPKPEQVWRDGAKPAVPYTSR
jgi:hypothetical protein